MAYQQISSWQFMSFLFGSYMVSSDSTFFLPEFSYVFPAYIYSALLGPKQLFLFSNGILNIQSGNPTSQVYIKEAERYIPHIR